jgi:hypothetical protein
MYSVVEDMELELENDKVFEFLHNLPKNRENAIHHTIGVTNTSAIVEGHTGWWLWRTAVANRRRVESLVALAKFIERWSPLSNIHLCVWLCDWANANFLLPLAELPTAMLFTHKSEALQTWTRSKEEELQECVTRNDMLSNRRVAIIDNYCVKKLKPGERDTQTELDVIELLLSIVTQVIANSAFVN